MYTGKLKIDIGMADNAEYKWRIECRVSRCLCNHATLVILSAAKNLLPQSQIIRCAQNDSAVA